MRHALVWPPVEWPKVAFPEHYAWPAVAARARAVVVTQAWKNACEIFGTALFADELVCIAHAPNAVAEFVSVPWLPAIRDDRAKGDDYAVLLPLQHPAEVVTLVGTAGAEHGNGGPTVVRFVLTLSQFANFSILALGEDALEMKVVAKHDWCALLIAKRVLQICPRMRLDVGAIAARIENEQRLRLDWA